MNLNFKIDDDYLITHTLSNMSPDRFSSDKHREDVVSFQDYAWEQGEILYNILAGRVMQSELMPDSSIVEEAQKTVTRMQEVVGDLPEYINNLKSSSEFKKIKSQTAEYLEFCENQWEDNYPEASDFIKEVTGFDLDKELDVYITHPALKNGGFHRERDFIRWGHSEDFPNYATVYLWHEILHSYFDKSELEHAIIELIADNELRARLNNTDYPPFQGHEHLDNFREKLLPTWREYLNRADKDIEEFIEKSKEVIAKKN